MTNDQIDELKQFIATIVHNEVDNAVEHKVRAVVQQEVRAVVQQEVRAVVQQEVRAVVQEELVPIRQDIQDLSEFVQHAGTESNDANQEQIDDHEVRLTRLEKAIA
jgi:predicted naringenin-chalcone synthase